MRRGLVCALAVALLTSGCAAGRDAQTQNQVPTQNGTNANAGSMALRGIALEGSSNSSGYPAGSAIPIRLVLVNNGTSDDRLTNIVTSAARGWAGYATAAQASAAASSQTSSTTPGTSGPSASTTPGTSASATTSGSTKSRTPKSKAPKSGATRSGAGSTSTSSPVTTPTTTPSSSASTAETAITIPAGQRVSFGVPDSKRVLLLLSSVGHVYPGTTVKVTFTFAKAGSVTATVPVQNASDTNDPVVGSGSGSDG